MSPAGEWHGGPRRMYAFVVAARRCHAMSQCKTETTSRFGGHLWGTPAFSYDARECVIPRTLILANFAIVVIGASVGGVAAMQKLVAGLDSRSPASYFVVVHIGPRESRLASILTAAGPLPAEA